MKRPLIPLLAFLGLVVLVPSLRAQSTGTGTTVLPSTHFDTSDFPQWGKDLRRAEIIAFGTLPFTMFTATFFMDAWRTYKHNGDLRYAPWPFKTAGAVDMTGKEHEITLTAAGVASLALGLTDFIIVQIKRYRTRQKVLRMPEGSPIIIKRPWPEGSSGDQSPLPGLSGETAETPAAEAPSVEPPAAETSGAPPAAP